MGAHGGPNLAEDGLVFYYDTGNGKSYKGEPTTNLLGATGDMAPPNPDTPYDLTTATSVSDVNGTTWDLSLYPATNLAADNGVTWDPYIKGPGFTGAWKLKKRPGGNGETQFQNGLGAVTNTTSIVLSVWCKCSVAGIARINANTTKDGASNWGNSSAYHSGSGEWEKLYYVIPANSGVTSINVLRCQVNGTTVNTDVYWRHYQVEYNTHATQFTTGTRSATESLYDFISDTALDVSNVSFDSNADITFDGTNDHISFSNNLLVPGVTLEGTISELTIDVWVNWNTFAVSGAYDEIISWWKGGTQTYLDGFLGASKTGVFSSTNPGLRFGDGWTNTGVSFTAATDVNKWWNIVAIKTATDAYIYVNGELRATKGSPLSWGFNDYPSIGRHPNYVEWLDGKIGALKLYNQALTAEEVQNNFNGIRSRFGI